MTEPVCPYVSRAGLKLAAALEEFGISVAGLSCADFGANVGGFTDCLLQRGAKRVYAVDTGYGVLAWKLRKDSRVMVLERTNALTAQPSELVDLVVIDVGWTPQRLILPAANRWLKPAGQVFSLLKPHYEATADSEQPSFRKNHVLSAPAARAQCMRTCEGLVDAGWRIRAVVPSPITGGGGNMEFVLWTTWGGIENKPASARS
ncbi:MAG: TlyA family rRNA (cytidine-2'-O)-methyltransferase [Planctomycetes bacterium]|nr:TlyA family rRNA (cytidine-2'-O)-methyltransferase [Planctomycetota bacterium]